MKEPEIAYNKFLELFTRSYDGNFPLKKQKSKMKVNKNKSPWITNRILKSVQKKHKLYKTFLLNSNDKNRQLYMKYENKLNHIKKIGKKT